MSDPFAELPRGHFKVIYADPPWRFETWSGTEVVQARELDGLGKRDREIRGGCGMKHKCFSGRHVRCENPFCSWWYAAAAVFQPLLRLAGFTLCLSRCRWTASGARLSLAWVGW